MLKLSRFIRQILALALIAGLSSCANMADTTPGTPLADVQAQFGRPNFNCTLPDGAQRVIWTQQPFGQFAWGANVGADGHIDQVVALLTDQNFQQLADGVWPAERVRCEFGPPAQIREVGLPSVRQIVWSYRYRQDQVWNSLMHVYMGRDGHQVTHFHPGPDPLFDNEWNSWR